MRTRKYFNNKINYLLGLFLIASIGCEREISDAAVIATFPTTAEVFTDSPIGMGSDFYFPYGGSKATAWSVDEEVSYEGTASMRFDIPNADDAEGNYGGAIFRIDGAGRDLSGYDALTFWVKASQGVVVGEFGFGEDFGENKYVATIQNTSVSTAWTKVIIPIPDASKLTEERGLFRYSAGTQDTNGLGYTFWVDELKFEKLGTIAQPRPKMQNGEEKVEVGFTGGKIQVTGLTQTFNLPNGSNKTVATAGHYYNFTTSDVSVAGVNRTGEITVYSEGSALITATLGGVDVEGSLTVNSLGDFNSAPEPTRPAANVISIFSNAYDNVSVDFFNGYWAPWQTTLSADFTVNGDDILNYTDFNFVGTGFPVVNATSMTNVNFDIFIPEGGLPSSSSITITVKDFGADGVDGGTDDTTSTLIVSDADLVDGDWASVSLSLSGNKNNIGLIIYENSGSNAITNFYLDNIYFYK